MNSYLRRSRKSSILSTRKILKMMSLNHSVKKLDYNLNLNYNKNLNRIIRVKLLRAKYHPPLKATKLRRSK